jgi:hypothetical protein
MIRVHTMHIIIDQVASSLVVNRIDNLVKSIILITIKIPGLTTMTGIVEK